MSKSNKKAKRVITNSLKSVVKISPSDEEVFDAILNGYTVIGFHQSNGTELVIFSK